MQRHIMKHAVHTLRFHGVDKLGSVIKVSKQEVIHVRIMLATAWNHGATNTTGLLQRLECSVVAFPYREASGGKLSASSICAHKNAAMISPGRYDEPIFNQVYLSTWSRKNLLRLVPF